MTPYALCAVCVLLVGVLFVGYYGAVRFAVHGVGYCWHKDGNLMAASATLDDVMACMEMAEDGAVIIIPAGNVTWPSNPRETR